MSHHRTGICSGLAIAVLMASTMVLALGADLTGRSFDVAVIGGKTPRTMRLTFTATELTCPGVGTVPYTAKPRRIKTRITDFEASIEDAKGGSTVITGEVEGNHIHGSITFRPKEGEPVAINFTSEQAAKPKK